MKLMRCSELRCFALVDGMKQAQKLFHVSVR
jgi:hypothetical protein